MNEDVALKNLLKIGIVLSIGGFIITVTGLFSYIDEKSFFNIIIMSSGVIFTSLGYAFASLFFHRDKESYKTENHQNRVGYH